VLAGNYIRKVAKFREEEREREREREMCGRTADFFYCEAR
jgi:hypothetical protein